jgi:hypothetical protein
MIAAFESFDWYLIVNKTEFELDELPSREVTVVLEGVGQKTVMVTKGILISLVYDGVMLSPGLNDENPFGFGTYAAYIDDAGDVYLGIPVA